MRLISASGAASSHQPFIPSTGCSSSDAVRPTELSRFLVEHPANREFNDALSESNSHANPSSSCTADSYCENGER
jgi:hypothetical protein